MGSSKGIFLALLKSSSLAFSSDVSSSGSTEQILVRIDDKLSRIATTKQLGGPDEDTLSDLIGYLVLLKVAAQKKSNSIEINLEGVTC